MWRSSCRASTARAREGVETITAEDFDQVMQHQRARPDATDARCCCRSSTAAGGVLAVLSSKMGSIGEASGTRGWLYRASKAALNDGAEGGVAGSAARRRASR